LEETKRKKKEAEASKSLKESYKKASKPENLFLSQSQENQAVTTYKRVGTALPFSLWILTITVFHSIQNRIFSCFCRQAHRLTDVVKEVVEVEHLTGLFFCGTFPFDNEGFE
jgi:hypothetical protein